MILPVEWSVAIDALGAALLHFLWQGAALGLLYFLLRPLCATARARYRLGLGLVAALALCPLLTLAWLWPAADSAATAGDFGTIAAVAAQDVPKGLTLQGEVHARPFAPVGRRLPRRALSLAQGART